MPLYFAYGSNMDRAGMAERCPASRPLGPARLVRHRLVITRDGYASVARDPRRAVWGLLWDLALADIPALDRFESTHTGLYGRIMQSVLTETGPRRAILYLGRDAGPGTPRPGYVESVVAAAEAAGLPAEYIREIAALGGTRKAASEPAGAAPRTAAVRPTRSSPLDRPAAAKPWNWEP